MFFFSLLTLLDLIPMYHFSSDVWNWYKLFWLAVEFDRKKKNIFFLHTLLLLTTKTCLPSVSCFRIRLGKKMSCDGILQYYFFTLLKICHIFSCFSWNEEKVLLSSSINLLFLKSGHPLKKNYLGKCLHHHARRFEISSMNLYNLTKS